MWLGTMVRGLPFGRWLSPTVSGRRTEPRRRPPDAWRLRRESLLAGVDLATATGLEVGPLTSPLVGRHEGRVESVDHATTAELPVKYAADRNVDVSRLVEVDRVLDEGRLPAALRGRGFHYPIAAHVFEHLPNPLGWLRDCAEILGRGGVVGLTISDKRFTFDRLRPQTVLALPSAGGHDPRDRAAGFRAAADSTHRGSPYDDAA